MSMMPRTSVARRRKFDTSHQALAHNLWWAMTCRSWSGKSSFIATVSAICEC